MIAPVRTLSYIYEQHYYPIRHKHRSEGTAEFYRGKIRQFEAFLGTPLDVRYLRTEHIDGYVASRKCRPSTLNGDLRVLRSLYRFCRKRGYLKKRVLIEMQPESLDDPESWSAEELRALLYEAGQQRGRILGIPAGLWWTTLLLVVLNTGSRISAIMRLQVDDYDPVSGILRRRSKTQKQRQTQSDELAPVVRNCVEQLILWAPERKTLFAWPYDRERARQRKSYQWQTLRRHYKKILQRAELTVTRKDKFHKIRRSSATFVTASSDVATAQQFLGHSSAKVTQAYIDRRKIAQTSINQFIPWETLFPTKRIEPLPTAG